MNDLVKSLQEIARLAERSTGAQELTSALNLARSAIKKMGASPALETLDTELGTWQTKLSVILREPAGRHGMAHHCRYWIEKLKAVKI